MAPTEQISASSERNSKAIAAEWKLFFQLGTAHLAAFIGGAVALACARGGKMSSAHRTVSPSARRSVGPGGRERIALPARHVWLVLLWAIVAGVLVSAQPSAPPDLDRWVRRAMQTFEVPGIGLAIVKDDAVVLAKGYGVR